MRAYVSIHDVRAEIVENMFKAHGVYAVGKMLW